MEKYSLPFSLREDFAKALDRLYDERVDVHLGNHLGNNRHDEKVKSLGLGKNPFIEGESWKELIDAKRAEMNIYFD